MSATARSDEFQGYLLARPMPAENIKGWITTHRHSVATKHGDNRAPAGSPAT